MEGTKSKERVQKHGEVFTPDSIVNDMLDLVDGQFDKTELEKYIDALYLEPSCGNGNFLIRILDRKLEAVQKLPREQWNIGLLRALSSIYGVDIQSDNVEESKERMIELIKNGTVEILELKDKEKLGFNFEKYELTPELEKAARKILDLNIIHGNCLSGNRWTGNKAVGIEESETTDPMIFIEYKWNNEHLTCLGHTLDDIRTDAKEDRLDNHGKSVHYTELDKINFVYKSEMDDYDF